MRSAAVAPNLGEPGTSALRTPDDDLESGRDSNSDLALPTTLRIVHHHEHKIGEGDVANKASIDEEISKFLGHEGRLPAFEFIFVENIQPSFFFLPKWLCGGWGPAFGHAALAFTRPDGTRCLVNIVGGRQKNELVDVWEKPYDYVYGVKGQSSKGGIFARSLCIIRVQEWDASGIEALELYLRTMLASFKSVGGAANWHNCGQCINLCSWLGYGRVRPYGNCSDWLSRACFLAGLLRRPHTFPKAALVEMLETLILDAPPDAPKAEVVYLRQEEESRRARRWQRWRVWRSIVAPLHLLRNVVYWQLDTFADAEVTVRRHPETGELRAHVAAGPKRRPRWMRWLPFVHFHTQLVTVACIVFIGFGWPDRDPVGERCIGAAYMSRLLIAGVFLVINAILY